MGDIVFDRAPRFNELGEWLHQLADEYSDLVELEALGRSHEGREIWIATVTNRATGPHHEKPAVWLDGNIHASETTATVALLHLLHTLCSGFGTDERITRALDTRTFYVVPRLNPDGAELALGEVPFIVRSNTRAWPHEEQLDGLVPGDIDHDGRQLQMRVVDPNGAWKAYAPDPRLIVARDPDEDGAGPYYRLLGEGRVHGYDGVSVTTAPVRAGIDANRNFPYHWKRYPGHAPWGAGDYPTSEPEIRAVVQGIVDRKNVGAYFAYHTFSGVHLRPYGDRSDDHFPTDDLWTYQELGRRATEITGYPSISTWHDFRYHPKGTITGGSTDWAFEHLGLYAWVTEFWNVLTAAGLTDADPLEWYRTHPLDEELQLLAWVDDNVPGGYVDWYPYDHPELGPVELGGWNAALVFRNPPPHLLEAEVAPHSELAVFQALCSPLLRLRDTVVEPAGEGAWRVRVVVENSGWLPTNISEKAIEQRAVLPTIARLTLPEGADLVSGTERVDLGQLTGRALKHHAVRQFGNSDDTTDRAVAEWVIDAAAGTTVDVEVRHDRAGVVRTSITLDAP